MKRPGELLMIIGAAAMFFCMTAAALASADKGVETALKTADSLSRAKGTTGAVKARSFKTLGDYQFVKEDYKKAADFYKQAMGHDTSVVYRRLYEFTVKMTGDTASAANRQATPVDSQDKSAIFTIQVGAFGSKENADNMVKKLTGKYRDITISEAAGGGQTLYRVRVESFTIMEDATAFADKMLAETGMPARVVEK